MVVQFMVKNFLSFKDETILDMSAINAYKEHDYNLIDIDLKEKYLKVATIYGANASGKTNLFVAMQNFQRIVSRSLNNVDEQNELAITVGYQPYKFSREIKNTEFQLIQIINDCEYKYGFEYNKDRIVTEWLYKKSLKSNRTITIFEREENKISFGASVKKHCEIFKEQLPTETLALSFFNKLKLKTDIYNLVYEGIIDILIIHSDLYEKQFFLKSFLKSVIDLDKKDLISFLSAIDTGITNVSYIENDDSIDFFTHHIGEDGDEYLLDLYNESEGTIKSISIYINAMVAIKNGKSIFIDELNAKLHPLLLKFIIDLFNNKSNQQAQLIYTTHDTTLLDKRFFRRDQIWFVEKNEYGHSKLTALSDFKVRTDASFEKDYLSGVYGGIPFIQEFSFKVGE